MKRITRAVRPHLLVWLLYLAAALLITFPAILRLDTQILGGPTSDSLEMSRHIWWFKTALQNGLPLSWQSLLGYPEGISGLSLLAHPLQYFPWALLAFVLPLPLTFNVVVLATMGLNGWALYLLARDRLPGTSAYPALLAGLVFMAAPTFQGHLFDGHGGLMVQWPVPLLLLALFRIAERFTWRWFITALIFVVLAPGGHFLQTIYLLLPLLGLFWLGRVAQRDWGGALRVLLVGLAGGALMLLYHLPIIADTLQSEAYTQTGGFVRYSLDLLAIVTPSFLHPLFGGLDYTRRVLGVNLAEGSAYAGLLVMLVSLIGLRQTRAARWWLLLALIAWVMALGPLLKVFDQPVVLNVGEQQSYVTLPYAFFQNLPGMSIARTPARFSFLLALALAMLAGYGFAALWPRLRLTATRQALLAALCAGIILLEYQFFWPMPTRDATLPAALYALRQRDDVRAIFDVPHDHLLAAKDALYYQTAHEKPLIAGQLARQTPVNPAKLSLLEMTLDPALLQASGADLVLLHRARAAEIGRLDELQTRLQAQLGAPEYEDERIALYRVPPAGEAALYMVSEAASAVDVYRADVYAPAPLWLDWRATLQAQDRSAVLRLNGLPFADFTIAEALEDHFALPAPSAGFYALELRLDPPCPVAPSPALRCATLNVLRPEFTLAGDYVAVDGRFANGARLLGISAPVLEDGTLVVRLHWQHDAALGEDAIRYVHVGPPGNAPLAQSDVAPGAQPAGQVRTEIVRIPLGGVAPGVYPLRLGWYSYPSIAASELIEAGALEAEGAALLLGEIRVP